MLIITLSSQTYTFQHMKNFYKQCKKVSEKNFSKFMLTEVTAGFYICCRASFAASNSTISLIFTGYKRVQKLARRWTQCKTVHFFDSKLFHIIHQNFTNIIPIEMQHNILKREENSDLVVCMTKNMIPRFSI